MPVKEFGSTSENTEKKINTSLFVQKPHVRIYFIESNFEGTVI